MFYKSGAERQICQYQSSIVKRLTFVIRSEKVPKRKVCEDGFCNEVNFHFSSTNGTTQADDEGNFNFFFFFSLDVIQTEKHSEAINVLSVL